METRTKNSLICVFALSLGCLLYVLFRPTTYIGSFLNRFTFVYNVRQVCSPCATDLFKAYLPDFLWGLSLGCGLIAIYLPRPTGIVLCSLFSFLSGFAWECLQYCNIVSGTGDVHDVVMYFLAGTVCIIINIKETKRK